jgi:hypothetical protein
MADQPHPAFRRPWLRISLRGLLVIVLIAGCSLGWMVRSAQVQRDTVRTIQRAGGSVWYEWEWKNGRVVPGAKPPAPSWLVSRIGIDYFGSVVAVQINERQVAFRLAQSVGILRETYQRDGLLVSHATLTKLGDLKRLEFLTLDGTLTDDSGLGHLKNLRRLKHLSLVDTGVTDAGLVHLKAMADLRALILSRTDVTDAGIRDLVKSLPNLSAAR